MKKTNIKKINTYQIDRKYRNLLKKTCLYVLAFNRGLPLEWEDLYNNFLIDAPKILEAFDESKGLKITTYLQIQCKNNCFNYCRSFKTNKHRTMNEVRNLDSEPNKALGDSVRFDSPIDISVFSTLELLVYRAHFLEGLSIKNIAEKYNLTIYRVRNLSDAIKVKLRLQLKN